ncbi:MAG TPA: pantoate--beta-alanine ligase [Bacteroidia bacterium]|nr:pantoate--beta-alanine ligase [Bacteroidia bacterium]
MKIFTTIKEIQNELQQHSNEKKQIGFVPTMGALHEGHLQLIRQAVSENAITVCSIFVNPTQFNNPDDLAKYPRTETTDSGMLEENKCDIVFIPSVDEMYPEKNLLDINFGSMETVMEGVFRPGHFKGVATVVKKLFDIVQPDIAYFGKKDFQQLAIIRNLVRQLKLKVKITGCETVREKDGLAMSSRNIHLTTEERANAPVIYKSLLKAKDSYRKNFSLNEIKKNAVGEIEKTNLYKVQYFEIVNAETLELIDKTIHGIAAQACIAVLTSKTRLIDNIALN